MRLVGAHINEPEISALDAIAQAHRVSRAVVIRWAITQYLRLHDKTVADIAEDMPERPAIRPDHTRPRT